MSPYRRHAQAERRDHYQEVTDQIVVALEQGTKPWRRPWEDARCGGPSMPINGATGRAYHGINVLILAMSRFAFGSGDPRFCSFKQAKDRGWQVRRGERSTTVFFFKRLVVKDKTPPEADDQTRRIPMLRAYSVFHASQLEGIPPYVAPALVDAPWRRPDAADLILKNSGADIRIGGNRAFYAPGPDYIQMPNDGAFNSPELWAAVALHEGAHWAGSEKRLNRDLSGRFGSRAYAAEEVIAEISSCFIGAVLGLPCDIPHHADYLAEWIAILRSDKRAVFHAAAAAQKTADFLLGFHPDYARALAMDHEGEPTTETAASPADEAIAEAA